MSRAVIARQLGPIDNYSLCSFEPPALGPNDVRIAIRAVAVSYVDVLVAAGGYQVKPGVPFTPGSECAGIVTATGSAVTTLCIGQPVIATGWHGLYADTATVPASALWPKPENLSFAESAALHVSYTTAWHALADRGRLRHGETLLILGAGGATGLAAVQAGVYLGARVIASASSEPKRRLALQAGAHAAVDSNSSQWRDAVRAVNDGKAVDVVFDPVGGDVTQRAFRTLAWNGRHLVVGFPAGIVSLPTNLPLLKSASLIGVNVAQLSAADPVLATNNTLRVLELAKQNHFKPVIAATYPLERFADAMRAASQSNAAGIAGRIVIAADT
ncbi:MAG TPA: NADPH:quinone oxidoreductase family protein [Steroidobacteraceae bacterium]|nr:NADPH:quinone oxidoreductase family protein [Steroidobacteraceae bacterium]